MSFEAVLGISRQQFSGFPPVPREAVRWSVQRNHGLTMLEVMIAVMVLGLGLTAVAGLFPIAGTIQRRTYDDMVTSQMGDSVQSTVQGRGFSEVDLLSLYPNPPALITLPRRSL